MTALHKKWSGLEDLTEDIQLKLNSYPGLDERIISEYALKKGIKKPFLVRQGNVVYLANPSLIEGALWWKTIKVAHIKKQVWEDFRNDPHSIIGTPEHKILKEFLMSPESSK
jgi:hypothetical protein